MSRPKITFQERNRLLAKAIQKKRENAEPEPLLLVMTAEDIPTALRGELVWSGAAGERRFFYEIGKHGDLLLYGLPIYAKQLCIRRGYKKKLWCRECQHWTARLLFIAAQGNGPWCPTCFSHGTPFQHDAVRMGVAVRWPVEMWGSQEPLRIAATKKRAKKN